MPALDGLRALAVLAVVLYHGEVSSIPGGFLGVEVFFVISGYLITALLLAERQGTGRTAYLQFWLRRARRLLPALFALVAVVATVWVVLHHDEVARVRGDIVGALLYVTNWYQIVVHQSYFEVMGRPSPLRHLWSLAVEEQFYLVWPLVLAFLYRLTHARRDRMAWITVGLAIASAVFAMVLFAPGADPSRIYYGTDTRASGVLLGAALAMVAPPWLMRARVVSGARYAMTAIGAVGLVGVVVMILTLDEYDAFVYRGGFVLLDLFTLATIIGLAHPCRTVLSRLFATAPMLWIGRRSYGIYLWHWPIFVLTRPGVDVPLSGAPLLVLRLALTFGVAEVSYRWIEMPVRNGALSRWWNGRSERGGLVSPRARRPVLAGALAAVVVVAMVVFAAPPASRLAGVDLTGVVTDELGTVIDDGPGAGVAPAAPAALATTSTTAPAGTSTSRPAGTTSSSAAASSSTTATNPSASSSSTTTAAGGGGMSASSTGAGSGTIAIGDSVLLGARAAVRSALPGITVNAEVGRQFNVMPSLIRQLAAAGALRPNVVIHLGTNGPPTDADLKKVLDSLAGVRRVVLVNTSEDRAWQDVTNSRIAAAAAGRRNVVVADWHGLSSAHPGWFVQDGIHLSADGAAAYASMIASLVA